VATIQLTGDYDAGKKLVGKYVLKKDGKFTLAPQLKKIRDLTKDRFAKAGIHTLTMKYEVHEL
jgi:hypothetical protein